MTKETDFSTAVFVGDCKEIAFNNEISKREMIITFWESAPEIKKALKEQKSFTDEDCITKFPEDIFEGLRATLKQHGITVKDD